MVKVLGDAVSAGVPDTALHPLTLPAIGATDPVDVIRLRVTCAMSMPRLISCSNLYAHLVVCPMSPCTHHSVLHTCRTLVPVLLHGSLNSIQVCFSEARVDMTPTVKRNVKALLLFKR